jgi:hypothetical protein
MSTNKPGFSVRILLQDGEVEGVRFLEIANWTGIAILSPRERYLELRNEPEFERTGVYILTGPDPSGDGSTREPLENTSRAPAGARRSQLPQGAARNRDRFSRASLKGLPCCTEKH